MTANHYDAIVIGGGLAGAITARILSEQRYRTLVIEKQARLGQNNLSLRNARGETFDQGYHALDENRSPFTTRFFTKVLGGRCHRLRLQRGIVIRGHLFDFNAPVAEWPAALAKEFPASEIEDNLENAPTRDALAGVYGAPFANLAFNEILPSYPGLLWMRDHGVPEEKLLGLIYPWFFPRARRPARAQDESARFHAAARQSGEQHILYPDEGGFGAFIEGIVQGIDGQFAEVRTKVMDIQCRLESGTTRIASVQHDGVTSTADHYFWCAPVTGLAKLAGLRVPTLHPQKLALGSYSFDREVACEYHEILVGDPQIPIGRISFPGRIGNGRNHLVQVEQLFPAKFKEVDGEIWREECLESFRRLGIVAREAEVEHYDCTIESRGFVSVEDLHATVEDYRVSFARPDSNITIPHLGLGPENINRVVPSVFRTVYERIMQ